MAIRAGPQASRLRVLKYLHIHIRFALIDLTQAGRLRSRSYFDHSKISIKKTRKQAINSIRQQYQLINIALAKFSYYVFPTFSRPLTSKVREE